MAPSLPAHPKPGGEPNLYHLWIDEEAGSVTSMLLFTAVFQFLICHVHGNLPGMRRE